MTGRPTVRQTTADGSHGSTGSPGPVCPARSAWSGRMTEPLSPEAPATLRALPAGPDPAMLEEIRAGAPSALGLRFFEKFGGILLFRRGTGGPCSLVELSWRIDPIARRGLLGMTLLLALLSAILSGLLSALVVVRPVIGRVQRLGRAAAQVGNTTGYASALEGDHDELGMLSKQLDAAHERIRSATQALIDRNRNLESNLADVAHDLKTPLSAVQLALESLAGTRHRDAGREADRETLRRCLDDCVYLAEMIDNLRVGSQLAEGVSPDADGVRAEVGEIVGQVVRRLRPLARFRSRATRCKWRLNTMKRSLCLRSSARASTCSLVISPCLAARTTSSLRKLGVWRRAQPCW